MLPGVALLVTLCWLTSLERYLGVRYHVSLESALPEAVADAVFAPSRWLDDRVRAGGSRPLFRLAWPSATDEAEPATPVVKTPQPPQLEDLPGFARRRFFADARATKIAAGCAAHFIGR